MNDIYHVKLMLIIIDKSILKGLQNLDCLSVEYVIL